MPDSLGARLLRQAALVDAELSVEMLREQLLQRVMLFAPEEAGGGAGCKPERPQLASLAKRFDEAVAALRGLSHGD